MKTKQEKINLIRETAAFFNSNNRCVDQRGTCKYYREDKAGCAIGRLIKNKKLCKRLDRRDMTEVRYVFESFPNYLKEYGWAFLSDLQELHDTTSNWNKKGLTVGGKLRKRTMVEKVRRGEY